MDREHRDWYSVSQAAEVLGVTPEAVRLMSLRGDVPYRTTPLGRLYPRRRIDQEAVERRGRIAAMGRRAHPAASVA
jgi:hypothetical protein